MADGVYKLLAGYAAALKIDVAGFGPPALRATAATNVLERGLYCQAPGTAGARQYRDHAYLRQARNVAGG